MDKFDQLVEEVFRNHFFRTNKPSHDSQLWKGEWWTPEEGCDTLENMFADLKARLLARRKANGTAK